MDVTAKDAEEHHAYSNRSRMPGRPDSMLYSRDLPAATHSLVSVFKKVLASFIYFYSLLVDLTLQPKKAAHNHWKKKKKKKKS